MNVCLWPSRSEGNALRFWSVFGEMRGRRLSAKECSRLSWRLFWLSPAMSRFALIKGPEANLAARSAVHLGEVEVADPAAPAAVTMFFGAKAKTIKSTSISVKRGKYMKYALTAGLAVMLSLAGRVRAVMDFLHGQAATFGEAK